MEIPHTPRIGTAGWSAPHERAAAFPAGGSTLERYAARFDAAEINSSFYRPHRRSTYERWAASVPEHFRFAVKLPRAITHDQRLVATDVLLDVFLEEARGLGDRFGPLLVQLPPSLVFQPDVAGQFFAELRTVHAGAVVCEPRHASWGSTEADALLASLRIARVAADPARWPGAERTGGWPGLVYARLHGSPRIYYSSYDESSLATVAEMMRAGARAAAECWCVFDNTASGAATGNALALGTMLT